MMTRTRILLAVALLATACATEESMDDIETDGELVDLAPGQSAPDEGKADAPVIGFQPFSDSIGTRGTVETRRTFYTAADYRGYFGHDAPGVDFRSEWVVFYSAGNKRTGGFEASITGISTTSAGRTLTVTTRLVTPGNGCFTTFGTTRPYVLAKLRRPTANNLPVRYYRSDETRACTSTFRDCSAVACPRGTTCQMRLGYASCTDGRGAFELPSSSDSCATTICLSGLTCDDSSGYAGCYQGPMVSFPGRPPAQIPVDDVRCNTIACPVSMVCIDSPAGSSCQSQTFACRNCNAATSTCLLTSNYSVQCVPRSTIPGTN